jgi:hypothetical protein
MASRARAYSFIVKSPDTLLFGKYKIALDEGRNVFNILLDDVQEFRRVLAEKGVEVLTVNDLNSDDDNHIPPQWVLDSVAEGDQEALSVGPAPFLANSKKAPDWKPVVSILDVLGKHT